MSNFRIEGNKIFSLSTGDLVAVIENGNVKMQPGKNAMTPKVKAFYLQHNQFQSEVTALQPTVPDAEATVPDAEEEEVNTTFLSEETDKVRIYFGDAPNRGGTSAPDRDDNPEEKKELEQLAMWDIPDCELPEFSPALGTSTPEFKNFVKKHKLSQAQIIELVKRLERM